MILRFSIDNMIDEDSFLLTNEETSKEMQTPVGPRLKILKKLQELQFRYVKMSRQIYIKTGNVSMHIINA